MALKLYGLLISPPVRAVTLCAKALKLDLELVKIDFIKGDHLKEEFLKKNPTHTVPVLIDNDFILYDSHAIMGYLVDKYGKDDSLYPKNDYAKKALINQSLHFDSSLLWPSVKPITRPLVTQGIKPSQEKLDALKKVVGYLNRILTDNKTKYLAGDNVTIADYSIAMSVTSVEVFFSYDDFPSVKTYVENIRKLPYFHVIEEGLNQQKSRILARLNE